MDSLGRSRKDRTIVKVENLTKQVRIFRRKEGVWGGFQNLFKRDYHLLTAVNQVSFNINRGEVVGYIGANCRQLRY